MTDDPRDPDERAAYDALPAEIEPPAGLEDRVVRALRTDGSLRPRRAAARMTSAAAAAAALFLAGFLAGRLPVAAAPADGRDQYLLLLYGARATTPGDEAARVAEYSAWAGEQAQQGRLVAAERLGDRFDVFGTPAGAPGRPDEPLGFFLIRAATAAEAAAVAAACPHTRHGGTVVLRPVAPTPR